jgi:pilus assembly protein Flp/PilA
MTLRESLATLRRFAADQSGANAVEYALLVAAICIAILAMVESMRDKLIAVFTNVSAIFS